MPSNIQADKLLMYARDIEKVGADNWSIQNGGPEIGLFTTLSEQKSLEVPVGQVQRKNLLPHKVGVRIEISSKNYVNDFKEDIG